MIVGFSGTRRGTTATQRRLARKFLREWFEPGSWFHHGDCVGSDEEVAAIARKIGYHLHAHPTLASIGFRAYVDSDIVEPEQPPIPRNRHIVDISYRMLITPGEVREVLRSGTWATIRYTRSQKKPLTILYPEGQQ